MSKGKDLSKASDEELQKRSDDLAEERTRIRLEQNDISAEIELRAAYKGMSGAARDALRLRLEGKVESKGETA